MSLVADVIHQYQDLERIGNGEKLAKIVQKLDPKTRNAIQAEMQKP